MKRRIGLLTTFILLLLLMLQPIGIITLSAGVETANTVAVKLTGAVRSYNPKNETTIRLMRGNTEMYKTVIAETTGSGPLEQPFTFDSVMPGIYTLVVSKPCHTVYTVHAVAIGNVDLDLTQDSRPEISMMKLRCGDINGDGLINDVDLTFLWMLSNYNRAKNNVTHPLCDLNGDGMINDMDLTILWMAQNYNRGAIEIQYSDVAIPTIELAVSHGGEYLVPISASNITDFTGMAVTVTYDPKLLRLMNVAEQIYDVPTAVGAIPGTGITIEDITPDSITLTFDNPIPQGKKWNGVITIFRFKALATGTATISVW